MHLKAGAEEESLGCRSRIRSERRSEPFIPLLMPVHQLPNQRILCLFRQAVDAAVLEAKPTGIKDMGKVMALLKPRLAGKADMGKVSALVKTKLSG